MKCSQTTNKVRTLEMQIKWILSFGLNAFVLWALSILQIQLISHVTSTGPVSLPRSACTPPGQPGQTEWHVVIIDVGNYTCGFPWKEADETTAGIKEWGAAFVISLEHLWRFGARMCCKLFCPDRSRNKRRGEFTAHIWGFKEFKQNANNDFYYCMNLDQQKAKIWVFMMEFVV